MIAYNMRREGKTVAQVVTLDNGKCIVAWPTSTIVYDSEEAARAVHITHMGGRGEQTYFRPVWGSGKSFARGMENAAMDMNEGAPYAAITDNYKSLTPIGPRSHAGEPWHDCDDESFITGYLAHTGEWCSREMLLADIKEFAERRQAARNAEKAKDSAP